MRARLLGRAVWSITMSEMESVGSLMRKWRERRGLSQLALAVKAEVSSKHLSFVETGRSVPSREMVLHLSELLEVPLRDRNGLLVAAGYAPTFKARPLADPALAQARRAIEIVLRGHEPYPALAVDRHWTLISANRAIAPLLAGVAPQLLQSPVNVLRLGLHPEGIAPRIVNLGEWRAHLLARLRREVEISADATLATLLRELESYGPRPASGRGEPAHDRDAIIVPLRLRSERGVLSLMSTTTVFGTPIDVTLAELAIESFFPADDATAALLREQAPTS